jgi:uncharacterized membrane protein HdeD (DUF308 family)
MLESAGIRNIDIGRSWGWVLASGIAYVLIGFVALNWPVSSTVGLTFALGIVLVVTGVVQAIHAFQTRHETGISWRIFLAVIALAAGVLMLRYPAAGMMGVAIAMAFYFFVNAAAKGALAFSMRPIKRWGWVLASAIASFILGVYVIATFPLAALWVPGFILGVDLVIQGASLVAASFDLRHEHEGFVRRRQPSMA